MIGMRLLEGREFTWRDDEHAPRVAVISESLARTIFAKKNPVGHLINVGNDAEREEVKIIGVVNSASLWKFDGHEPLAIYHALIQENQRGHVLIRTRGNPLSVAHAAEHVVESFGNQHSLRTETFEQRAGETLVLQRMIGLLASGFSLLALLLAAIGLYGVMSYTVTRRTAEIGVRMAVGAMRTDILSMILGEVLLLIAIGIGVALPVAFACRRLISGMLFGVSVTDPATVVVASSILIAVAAVAAFLPARARRA